MATAQPQRETLDDLYRFPGKAELIGGRIVPLMATGRRPNRIAFRISRSLDDYAQQRGVGEAYTDNMGFSVTGLPSGRESFSPDASYHSGPFPTDPMRFIEAAPTLAVEVRGEYDYGDSAEGDLAAKRADYFAAGTVVVWDVDTLHELIRVYRATDPDSPTTYGHGQLAEAEPAAPGWRVAVDRIFS
ncbi:MAG: Uma2 family endonuclease [Planctomycetia bacterium]|nr:Uma2 family endonuclease [Planctomycetia bacterium]